MGLKSNETMVRTNLDIRAAARVVNQAFAQEKAEVEPIDMGNNPLDALEGQPDLAVVGSRQGMMNQWAVQVYFEREDPGTLITFVSLGHSGFSRAMGGTKNTASLTKSTDQMNKLISALRSVDPQLAEG